MDGQLSFEFEQRKPIKGYPELHWTGKRPYTSTQYYPAQLKESYGEPKDGWMNKIFWGDNLQVMSHMLKEYRGKIDLIYIDPPFDSKADYKKKIKVKNKSVFNDSNSFEEKQYTDMWCNDEYLQFMFERLTIIKELLSEKGSIYLHCDYRKSHQLRMILEEVFGVNNLQNEIIWCYRGMAVSTNHFVRRHDTILFATKSSDYTFNWEKIAEPLEQSTIDKYRNIDENGRRFRLHGRNITGSPIQNCTDIDPVWLEKSPDLCRIDYLDDKVGSKPRDWFVMDYLNVMSAERENYPTQKPEELLKKIILASSNEGDIVFDCFMGSGTTQTVAMKLGRRFIGADINLGAIQTTTKRLITATKDLDATKYTGFEVYNVNNYDFFRNPVEAKELIIDALGIQKFDSSTIYDGELDGWMVKIMPTNRIATKADLEELKANLPYHTFEKRKEENPNGVVEKIRIICMGHEADLKASLEQELSAYKLEIEILDILRDKTDLQFKREADANVVKENNNVVIKEFYPMNLLQKLSMQKESVDDWRQLVESIYIDWNYDGETMRPAVCDIPGKDELVSGVYEIPSSATKIKIKITDLISESLELEV
ncbi:MAG: site-specific DNA-methyltransferase [Lachnobacterium sp.]|nr:site-specific DNA-methyltransferase [Lachnobacterium sp.]